MVDRPHPNGVEPFGNYYLKSARSIRSGLGRLVRLSDELVLQVLSSLSGPDLVKLAATSRAFYVFCNHEELWRSLTLQELEGRFRIWQSWKTTYLQATQPGFAPSSRQRSLSFKGLYSDVLFQPHFCATLPLNPSWLKSNNVDRRSGLSVLDFREQYEIPNRPVIITDIVPSWPAFKKWERGYLQHAFSKAPVVVGSYEMDFDNFLAYCDESHDDMPLYLFDKHFAKRAPELAADFEVPEYFQDDLFSLLGEERRPDHRWIIMGPARSGSSFHKDPNSTSAWNAVIRGSKKWVMFPPNVTPPGVIASDDGADVATPVSLTEWFVSFYEQANSSKQQMRECVVKAGELLFVPRGWWHLALNLEESIALTQNFVSPVNLPHVLRFLATGSKELISGCSEEDRQTIHQRLVSALQESAPQVLAAAQGECGSKKASPLASLFQTPKEQEATPVSGFSFGFSMS